MSSGLELVAESGHTSILHAELDEAGRRGRVRERFEAPGLASMPGNITASLRADDTHHPLSFVSMLAPSPDWFTGFSAIELRPEEE